MHFWCALGAPLQCWTSCDNYYCHICVLFYCPRKIPNQFLSISKRVIFSLCNAFFSVWKLQLDIMLYQPFETHFRIEKLFIWKLKNNPKSKYKSNLWLGTLRYYPHSVCATVYDTWKHDKRSLANVNVIYQILSA